MAEPWSSALDNALGMFSAALADLTRCPCRQHQDAATDARKNVVALVGAWIKPAPPPEPATTPVYGTQEHVLKEARRVATGWRLSSGNLTPPLRVALSDLAYEVDVAQTKPEPASRSQMKRIEAQSKGEPAREGDVEPPRLPPTPDEWAAVVAERDALKARHKELLDQVATISERALTELTALRARHEAVMGAARRAKTAYLKHTDVRLREIDEAMEALDRALAAAEDK